MHSEHAQSTGFSLRLPLSRGLSADELSTDETEGSSIAAGDACERILRTLTRIVGSAGSRALFTRALAQTQAEHAALRDIAISTGDEVELQGIAESSASYGDAAVVEGLETLLSALLELLGSLIGADMVVRLVAQSAPMELVEGEGD
jgi:hypothetical protein